MVALEGNDRGEYPAVIIPARLRSFAKRGRLAGLGVAAVVAVTFGVVAVKSEHQGHPAPSETPGRAQSSPTASGKSLASRVSPVQAALPSCPSGALYSAPPVPLDKVSYILPLGTFTPLPSEHIYFVITRGNPTANSGPTETVDLIAPGDITVYNIGRQVQTTNGVVVNTDYFMSFASCREVGGSFGHVSSISGPLSHIEYNNCQQPYSIGNGSLYQHCTADINIKVTAGTVIGTAGGKSSAALDFSNDDQRVPMPYVANPDHNYDFTATCAVSYYGAAMKAKMQPLMARQGDGTYLSQGCGDVFQDQMGTLQGNWYDGPPAVSNFDITRQLSLAHKASDPTVGAISIGGTISQKAEWDFAPEHSGSVNRAFSEVTPGATIYCYHAANMPGRILIQLVSETNLMIEAQAADCAADVAFSAPASYQR